MKLLAIDAATEGCSVALSVGEEIFRRQEIAPRGHAQRLLPMVDEVLAESGLSLKSLDAIAFDRGPGSFTGVRVGTSVTQGLAFGLDLPVIPVSSLAILAQGIWQEQQQKQVLAVIDARMEEVYWGLFRLEDGIMQLQGIEHISQAEDVTPEIQESWYGAGSGWCYASEIQPGLSGSCTGMDKSRLPLASDMLPLARYYFEQQQFVRADQALPSYLRNEVAHKQSRV